jgi:phosphoadenosine phosphosulfate reductase
MIRLTDHDAAATDGDGTEAEAAGPSPVQPGHASLSSAPDLAELAKVSAKLESAPATSVIKWAWERYGTALVLASSFQDCVLLDLAMRAAPDIEVVFLDTQYHFPETWAYVETIKARYDLDLRIVEPEIEPDERWKTDIDACCAARKVEPLARALHGKAAWMTGVRRDETPARANAPIVGFDIGRGIVKVNPIATWTSFDVVQYELDRDLPHHPLHEQGYGSIGCWPCTRALAPGEDPRAGRWAGTGKVECGLHA